MCYYILIHGQLLSWEHCFQWWIWMWNKNQYTVLKEPQRFKTWQKWRVKKAKSKSLSNSKSGNVRCNLTSKIHNHHETLELILIIKPLGFPKVDLLTSWYYTMNQKHLWKKAYILNLKNEAMLLVKTFLIHN